jgi:hypothetical protein
MSPQARISCISRQKLDRYDGCLASLYESVGDPDVVAMGGQKTKLTMWIAPYLYTQILPRTYHPRWWGRLSREFDRACQDLHQQKGDT